MIIYAYFDASFDAVKGIAGIGVLIQNEKHKWFYKSYVSRMQFIFSATQVS